MPAMFLGLTFYDRVNIEDKRSRVLVAGTIVLFALAVLLPMVAAGRTFTKQFPWDLMIVYDGAHRILMGQIPNRDFHTPLGLLLYWLLATGVWLTGSVGGMMPMVTALFVLLLMPLLLYTCLSRLPWAFALGFGLHVVILAAVPYLTGDTVAAPTFGMFYNRFGWALLSLLVLFALPRRKPLGTPVYDAISMTVICSMLFYLKVSYAAVGGAYLLGLIAFPKMRRSAIWATMACAFVLLVVELFWGETIAYISDLRAAGAVSGAIQGGLHGLVQAVVSNLNGLFLFFGVSLIGVIRRVEGRYLLVSFFIAAAGVLIANQNYGGPGILTLFPAAFVLLLAPTKSETWQAMPSTGAVLLASALVVPADVTALYTLATYLHEVLRKPRNNPDEVLLDGLMTRHIALADHQPGSLSSVDHGCGAISKSKLNFSITPAFRSDFEGEYLLTIKDGIMALNGNPKLLGTIFNFDMSNPFNALLGRRPLIGGDQFYHANRVFNLLVHPSAQEAIGSANVVMIPKSPVDWESFNQLGRLYGPYVSSNFYLVKRTSCWDIYGRV